MTSELRALRVVFAAFLSVFATLTPAPANATSSQVYSLAIDPVTPATLYAGSDSGVWKSTDGAATWSLTGLTSGHIYSLAVDPVTRTTVYARTDSGLFKSTDGGATWGAIGMTDSVSASPLAIAPVTPTTIYAVRGADSSGQPYGLFKSMNGGVTWQAVLALEVTSLAVDPVTPTTIYSGTQRRYFAGTSGVWKSTDGGENWTGGGDSWPYGTVTALAVDPVFPPTLYAGANRDYLCPECESDLYPDLFGVVVPGGAFKSTDGGVSWQAIGLTDVQVFSALAVAVNPMTTTTVYAATDVGLFKSTDGGTTWNPTGLGATSVSAIAVDPLTPSTLYAGTESGVLKSVDSGTTWFRPQSEDCFNGIDDDGDGLIDSQDPDCPLTCLGGEFCPAGYVCNPNGFCEPHCGNGFKDGDEGDVDCGGVCSAKCQNGQTCWVGSDCASGNCAGGSFCASAAALSAVTVAPASVVAGTVSTGTVTLGAAAPGGGAVVTLVSSNSAASVPASVTVPAGSLNVNFTVSTSPITTTTLVLISATSGGVTRSAQLTVTPPPDTAPPDTSITSATDGTGTAVANETATISTSLTLTFTGSDNVGVSRFECRLDGVGFSTCTSPLAHSGLAVGPHTFEVRAVDTSSNVDATPARHTWTVDTAPDTSITRAIDGRGKAIANGGTTSSSSVTFQFTGTDNGTIAGFECRLDAGQFTPCTSPATYTAQAKGAHTLRVRARDNNGFRDGTPAEFSWTKR